MLITLNQKEIETMILRGLTDMGIPHDNATINMVAGRSPNGITAEVKLSPATAVNTLSSTEVFGAENKAPEVTTVKESYGSTDPEDLPLKGDDSVKEKERAVEEDIDDTAALFND